MRTSKPIATVSYNSVEFLTHRLNELVKNKKVTTWIFIEHKAEEDERKDHIHLWLKPNTLIDTMDLQKFLEEFDPEHPDKPKKCIDFVSSKIDDWILYSMHFAPYLNSKMESRKYCYKKDDFYFSDEDTFEDLYLHALKGSEWAKKNQILEVLKDRRINPVTLIDKGMVPLHLAGSLSAYNNLKFGFTDRGGRSGHEEENPDDE